MILDLGVDAEILVHFDQKSDDWSYPQSTWFFSHGVDD